MFLKVGYLQKHYSNLNSSITNRPKYQQKQLETGIRACLDKGTDAIAKL